MTRCKKAVKRNTGLGEVIVVIETEHHFPLICYDPDHLKVDTLSTWMNRINKQATTDLDRFDPDKYKGDAFEHLIEVLIKLSPIDKRINIIGYSPTQKDEKGVDGVGRSHSGEVHTVQIKLRSNINAYLTEGEDHIAMFPAYSKTKYDASDMTIFTTCKGLHFQLDNFASKVRTHNGDQIKKLIDGNASFWHMYARDLEKHNG